jgi:prepilin-type N-terminal cleavage/methylation domain-containing protein
MRNWHAQIRLNNRGFSLIELFTALIIVGVLAAYGYPKLAKSLQTGNVRGAVAAVIAMDQRARTVAVVRGTPTKLVLTSGNLKVISKNMVSGATLTVTTQDIATQFNVTVTASKDTIKFDQRGLGTESTATTVIISNAALTDTVNITAIGRISH